MKFFTKIRVIFNLSFFQNSLNNDGMQNYGILTAIYPAVKKLGGKVKIRDIFIRHSEYFNTNPFFAPFIAGMIIRYEEKGDFEKSIKIKSDLSSFLGAFGDEIIWALLIPFMLIINIILTLSGLLYGFLFFFLFFNLFIFILRLFLLHSGYKNGEKAIVFFLNPGIKKVIAFFKQILFFISGVLLAFMIFKMQFFLQENVRFSLSRILIFLLISSSLIYYLLYRISLYYLYIVILISIIITNFLI